MQLYTRTLSILIILILATYAAHGQLTAGFTATPSSGCAPLVVAFTNTTTPATGTTYTWNLDNSTGSITLINPGTSYLTAGTYTITLTAVNGADTASDTQLITVYPDPAISFSVTDTVLCPGVTDTFSSTIVSGVPGMVTYLWSSGDGYTSTNSSYNHVYSFGGNFNVTLNATNSAGCSSILTKPAYIHVRTPPTAGFSASNTHICNPPVDAVFTSSATGSGPLTYKWNFGDGGSPSMLADPAHLYTATGAYSVQLTVTDSHGCQDSNTITGYINIINLTAAFTGPDSICLHSPASFTNTSSPYLSNIWLYGDGTTDASTNGYHIYPYAGSDTVKLVTYNGYCYDTVRHPIYVEHPASTFTITPTEPCPAPETSVFTATVLPGSTVTWVFGDGYSVIGNPATHNYTANGFYDVHMYVSSDLSCRDTSYKQYKIYNLIYDINIPYGEFKTGGCIPESVSFFDYYLTSTPGPGTTAYPYPVSSYAWNFGDGSPVSAADSPTHIFTSAGVYTVTSTILTANGCRDTSHAIVSAGIAPSVTFTASPTNICANNNDTNVTFTVKIISGTPDDYHWQFYSSIGATSSTSGSDTVLHYNFNHAGLYTCTLISFSDGCSSTFSRYNYITVDSPAAIIYDSIFCSSESTVHFFDSSEGEDSHIWVFGDGDTSSLKNPVHVYTVPAMYTGYLADYNAASGCRDTANFTVRPFSPDVSISTFDSAICRDNYVVIYPVVLSGTVFYYNWIAAGNYAQNNYFDFVDTFHTPGLYTVQLVVTDQNNCKDTITRTNYIHVAKPIANFIASSSIVCLPSQAAFFDSSTDVPGTFFSVFAWSFGDGGTAVTDSPSITHAYTNTGVYTATEIVTDNIGCKDTITKTLINVYHPTTSFSASITAGCAYFPINFTSISTASVTSYWTFGDGTTSTLPDPSHTYTDTGNYTVSLVVTDVHGCTDTFTRHNYINISKPSASFYMNDSVSVCPYFNVHFINTSTGGTTYKWNFGNGDSSIAFSPALTYSSPGYYTASLVVTNSSGCKDTAAAGHVNIFGYAGVLSYSPDTGCVPLTVTFNAALSSFTGFSSLTWDFSDGVTFTGTVSDTTYSHTYLLPGSFLPKLILTDTGCSTPSSTGKDTIKTDKINIGFKVSPNPVCVGDTLLLTDTSKSSRSVITARSWSYRGYTATTDTAYAFVTAAGNDSVSLTLTDGWGCSSVLKQDISAYTIGGITIFPDSVICTGTIASLSDTFPGGTWSSSNTTVASINTNSGVLTGIAGGASIITYRLTGGCLATIPVTVNAYPNPGIITGNAGVCTGSVVTLTDSVTGGTWNVTNSNAILTAPGILKGKTAGKDTLSYKVANGMCDSSAYKSITIYPLPDTGHITGQNTLCTGAIITLKDSLAKGIWTSSNLLIANIDSNTGTLKALIAGSVTIIYTVGPDSNGCINTSNFEIIISNIDFSVSKVISAVKCFNDKNGSIAVNISGGMPPIQLLWSTGSTGNTISNLDTGSYSIIITETATKCTVDDTFMITQPDTITITAEINEDLCRGSQGSVITNVSGGTSPYSYAWSDKNTGSAAEHLLMGNYDLTVTDNNGCRKQMSFIVPDTCNTIVIYDAISPNGDGINDTWIIFGIEKYPGNTVHVFDKYGDEVFAATNYNNDWEGKGKNGPLPDGTYYYLIKLNAANVAGGKNSFTGSILIKR